MRREIPFLSNRVWQALLIGGGVLFSVFLGFVLAQGEPFPMETVRNELPTVAAVAVAAEPLVFVTPTPAIAAVISTPQATAAADMTTNATEASTIPADEVTPSPVPPNEVCAAAPAGWQVYEVKEGDDINSLSIRSGATVAEIERANCLEMRMWVVGMFIYLPPTPPTRIPCGVRPFGWQPYIVRAGDTLYSLARTRGTRIYAIQNANCLTGIRINVGSQLYLPDVIVVLPSVVPSPTPTIRPSNTPVPPTVQPTNTSVPPTVTIILTVPPSATPTLEPMETAIPRPSLTPTTVLPTLPPRPTNAPVPTATNTPVPTNTAVPTNTPRPTNTNTPEPTNTPVPTETLAPPTDTPVPTNTPVPTDTAAPTNTPVPTDTPVLPTDTPVPPTDTPEPTTTPELTETPSS